MTSCASAGGIEPAYKALRTGSPACGADGTADSQNGKEQRPEEVRPAFGVLNVGWAGLKIKQGGACKALWRYCCLFEPAGRGRVAG